jgi:hypothetical protein
MRPYAKSYLYCYFGRCRTRFKSKGRLETSVNPQDRNGNKVYRSDSRGGYRLALKLELYHILKNL